MTHRLGNLDLRMDSLMEIKYGPEDTRGWSPRMRQRFHYYTPDDYYEAVVETAVDAGTEWLDIGGGRAPFANNPKLSRLLAGRCKRLVVVDPSSNVAENPYTNERHQAMLEDYRAESGFTLATARMVVEHVADPVRFVSRLGELIRPDGKVIIYTVDRWSPVTLLSGGTPMWFHHATKKVLWHTEESDTFPVVYQMNTRARLRELFTGAGFREAAFHSLDDCRALARWKATTAAELGTRAVLRAIGLPYPERCLLGIYQRLSR